MGPGFFPLALGVLMTIVGIGIVLTARAADPNASAAARKPWEWRGPLFIMLGILAFIVLGKHGGLVPATFALVFVSALGDRGNSLKSALLLSAAIVVICLIVFYWALQLRFPLFVWG